MKLINKKYKGFTLSELMIMLAVLTILLAAFAPVFTVRYNNATSENVWAFVQDDEELDAYTDQANQVMPAQLFVGITPANMSEVVSKAVSDGTNTLYSKLVIRPTDNLSGSENAQKQIQFRYGDTNTGDNVGALFAGNENILLGGYYKNISSATNNTAYGKGALSSITTGARNSALGYYALQSVSSKNDNTAIGSKAGESLNKTGNTLIGYNTTSTGDYVTAISDDLATASTIKRGDYSTVIGTNSGLNIGARNTIVGYNSGLTIGSNNTAIGNNALSSDKGVGSHNTAIGYNACAGVTGSNKTCIGYNSGVSTRDTDNSALLSDDYERIFIGSMPIKEVSTLAPQVGGGAVLEVHNINSINNNLAPVRGGNSSVVVNGNLIVRGQLYKSSLSRLRTRLPDDQYKYAHLIGFRLTQPKKLLQHSRVVAAYDGQERDWETYQNCRGCRRHAYSSGKTNCTCAIASQTSYDWTTRGDGTNADGNSCMHEYGTAYTDQTTGSRYAGNHQDINMAHRTDGKTCCPDLRSDIRLKNVSGKFTGGLDEIKKLMIYNYTYKSDETKSPHVGVIAQDLKRVFPTAVKKDKNGYYQIRWDEMLYAAINAIKTLNTKVEQLASRVANDQVRIANLKKDNAQLEKQLDTLSAELTILEKQHK